MRPWQRDARLVPWLALCSLLLWMLLSGPQTMPHSSEQMRTTQRLQLWLLLVQTLSQLQPRLLSAG